MVPIHTGIIESLHNRPEQSPWCQVQRTVCIVWLLALRSWFYIRQTSQLLLTVAAFAYNSSTSPEWRPIQLGPGTTLGTFRVWDIRPR